VNAPAAHCEKKLHPLFGERVTHAADLASGRPEAQRFCLDSGHDDQSTYSLIFGGAATMSDSVQTGLRSGTKFDPCKFMDKSIKRGEASLQLPTQLARANRSPSQNPVKLLS
jgi:hypothetical protein